MKKLINLIVILSIASFSFGQVNVEHYLNEMMSNAFTYAENESNHQMVSNRDILLRDSIVEFTGVELLRNRRWHYINNENQLWWIEAIANIVNSNWNIQRTNVRSFTPELNVNGIRTITGPLFNGTPFEDQDYNYNADGTFDEILVTRFEASDSTWRNYQKRTYAYDGFFEATSSDFDWDPDNEVWVIKSGIIYIERNNEFFPSVLMNLENNTANFIEYTWINNTNLPASITIDTEDEDMVMTPLLRASYTYEAGLQTEAIFELYNEDAEALVLSSKIESAYIDDEYLQTEDYYVRENDIWVFNQKRIHYYTETIVPTFEIANNDIKVIHANPISDGAPIQIQGIKENKNTTINIHDLQGKLILQKSIDTDQIIYLPELPNAIYVFQVIQDQKIILTEKLVKQ